jgi:hypothetical protein
MGGPASIVIGAQIACTQTWTKGLLQQMFV